MNLNNPGFTTIYIYIYIYTKHTHAHEIDGLRTITKDQLCLNSA